MGNDVSTDMNPENVNSVDFSDSIPNPYIGKVRRRVTMNTDMNNENGKVVTDEMIADWESALKRDERPNGWVNVGGVVEGKLPKAVTDTRAGADVTAEQEDAEGARGRERERSPMEFRLADGTMITNEDIERECAEYESGSWTGTVTGRLMRHGEV